MATNIKTFNKRGGDGVIISSTSKNRIIGIHSYSTVAGVIAIGDQTGTLVTYEVPASSMADIYIGDQGIKFSASISVSMPSDGSSCTLFVG